MIAITKISYYYTVLLHWKWTKNIEMWWQHNTLFYCRYRTEQFDIWNTFLHQKSCKSKHSIFGAHQV